MLERMLCAAYLVLPSLSYERFPPAADRGLRLMRLGAVNREGRLGTLSDLVEPSATGLSSRRGSGRDPRRAGSRGAEAFPPRIMRQMGGLRADYEARFVADWSSPELFGDAGSLGHGLEAALFFLRRVSSENAEKAKHD